MSESNASPAFVGVTHWEEGLYVWGGDSLEAVFVAVCRSLLMGQEACCVGRPGAGWAASLAEVKEKLDSDEGLGLDEAYDLLINEIESDFLPDPETATTTLLEVNG